MKLLKLIALSVVFAATFLAVSPVAYAEEHKDQNVTIQKAGDATDAQLKVAKTELEKKEACDFAVVDTALANVRQSQKDFRFEKTEHDRQKFNVKLKNAREAVNAKDYATALTNVDEALKIFSDMTTEYYKEHKRKI